MPRYHDFYVIGSNQETSNVLVTAPGNVEMEDDGCDGGRLHQAQIANTQSDTTLRI